MRTPKHWPISVLAGDALSHVQEQPGDKLFHCLTFCCSRSFVLLHGGGARIFVERVQKEKSPPARHGGATSLSSTCSQLSLRESRFANIFLFVSVYWSQGRAPCSLAGGIWPFQFRGFGLRISEHV